MSLFDILNDKGELISQKLQEKLDLEREDGRMWGANGRLLMDLTHDIPDGEADQRGTLTNFNPSAQTYQSLRKAMLIGFGLSQDEWKPAYQAVEQQLNFHQDLIDSNPEGKLKLEAARELLGVTVAVQDEESSRIAKLLLSGTYKALGAGKDLSERFAEGDLQVLNKARTAEAAKTMLAGKVKNILQDTGVALERIATTAAPNATPHQVAMADKVPQRP